MAAALERPTEAPQVVIVGCGIGGAALAAMLSRAGISSLILERNPSPLDRFRGEILQPYGTSILAALGFLDHIQAEDSGRVRTFHCLFPCVASVPEIKRSVVAATPLTDYAATCRHQTLYAALRRRILEDPGIRMQVDARVTAVELHRHGQWEVTAICHGRQMQFRAPIVVGADGAQSLVRQAQRFRTIRDATRTYLLGAVVRSRQADMETFVFVAEPDWIVYLFPLGNANARVSMEVNADFLEAHRGSLERSALQICSRTLKRYDYPLDDMTILSPMKVVGCPRVQNSDCLVEGAALIGDALGTVDPITGHGMTLACDDAWHMAAGIQAALREREDGRWSTPSRRWPKSRYRTWVERFSDLLVHGFLERSPAALQHRSEIAAWFVQREVSGSRFLQELTEIDAAIQTYLSQQQRTINVTGCGSAAEAV
jgi:2-polyprenyl-6-methoxyphenol hydroxylase-like FAD-dependent oxidoreductase